ncbi:MAG: transposase [Elusimicrobiota bacterium]
MPTHFHILVSDEQNYSSKYIQNVLDSYSKYFNAKHKRKGPLWQSRSKKLLVDNDNYFIHLTRYIHLNPVTAFLVNRPEEWNYSSYKEYLNGEENICKFIKYFPENYDFKGEYHRFVEDRADYQKKLAEIKHILIE